MGVVTRMRCRDCGHGFRLQQGGGMITSILFCEACGRGTAVPNDGAGEPRDLDEVDAPTRRFLIETGLAGICTHCHGELSSTAKPACTRCGSRRLEEGGVELYWD